MLLAGGRQQRAAVGGGENGRDSGIATDGDGRDGAGSNGQLPGGDGRRQLFTVADKTGRRTVLTMLPTPFCRPSQSTPFLVVSSRYLVPNPTILAIISVLRVPGSEPDNIGYY